MGAQISKVEDTIHDLYKKTWPTAWCVFRVVRTIRSEFFRFRYLAPSFLVSAGALGYVGYAFAQNKSASSSPQLLLLHLVGAAGGFGISSWMITVHGRSMQRLLSRHEYASVQSQLSTVYCSTTSVLASLSLGTYLLRHPFSRWSAGATNLVCRTSRRFQRRFNDHSFRRARL